ncbi:MAG: FAD-binding oxidoreductase [Chloroflexota bacterium]|nr:MAG: FAD-binding protein [Chloroflexota bacterium]
MITTASDQDVRASVPLPPGSFGVAEGWGMLHRAAGDVYRPSTPEGVLAVLRLARESRLSVVPRGSGYSYGDTALNAENIILDTTRLNRILDWNPETGIIRLEPGATVEQLWRYTLEDGWWPPVVPGAMHPTLGGCLATNVHGKNNWKAGTILDHILAAEMVTAGGEHISLSRENNPELLGATVGGVGMLGVFTSLTLRLERISSGLLNVREEAVRSLDEMFASFRSHSPRADYLIGWIDGFATGHDLGRGLVQIATHVHDDPEPGRTLSARAQLLPDTVLGIIPRSRLWLAMKPVVNDVGMRAVNRLRYAAGSKRAGRMTRVPHVQFHFFHDFVPGWKRAWQPGGILQYQVFVPRENAPAVFRAILEEPPAHGFTPYLAVFKLHRADASLLRYSVDGYSLSLDFHATERHYAGLQRTLTGLTTDVVLPAGGRFYLAKDSLLDRPTARRMLGDDAVDRFLELKRQLDPDEVLQSNLYRRALRAPR